MPREKIIFQANLPQTVVLEYTEGKFTEGQFGDQYYYSLVGNRCMYVPPVVYKQILDLEVKPGEPFEICKTVVKEGRSSVTRWIVGFPGQPNGSPHGQVAVPKLKEPERAAYDNGQNTPAPAARAIERPVSEAAGLHSQPTTPFLAPTRRERLTSLLVDCIHAVTDAASQTGKQLDGAQFQDLVSTLVIDDQKREEARMKHGFAVPAAQPREQRVNGGVTQ
jgi:hypothetical protein